MDAPTPEDMAVDLEAGLAACGAFVLTYDSWAALHALAGSACRRALAAEERVRSLEAALAEAEAQVHAVVPLGDLAGVPAWLAESDLYHARIADLEAERDALRALHSAACDRIAGQSELLSRAAEKGG